MLSASCWERCKRRRGGMWSEEEERWRRMWSEEEERRKRRFGALCVCCSASYLREHKEGKQVVGREGGGLAADGCGCLAGTWQRRRWTRTASPPLSKHNTPSAPTAFASRFPPPTPVYVSVFVCHCLESQSCLEAEGQPPFLKGAVGDLKLNG